MKVKCSCGKEIKQTIKYGIISYIHKEDDSYCDGLNSFYKEQNKVVEIVCEKIISSIKEYDYYSFNLYFLKHNEIIDCIADYLEGIKNEIELGKAFYFFNNSDIKFRDACYILNGLQKIFGAVEIKKALRKSGVKKFDGALLISINPENKRKLISINSSDGKITNEIISSLTKGKIKSKGKSDLKKVLREYIK